MIFKVFTLFMLLVVTFGRPSDLKAILDNHSSGKDILGATIPLELEIFVPQVPEPPGSHEEDSSNDDYDDISLTSTLPPTEETTTVTTTVKVPVKTENTPVKKLEELKNEIPVTTEKEIIDEDDIEEQVKFYFKNINLNLMVGKPEEAVGVNVQAAVRDEKVAPELLGNYFEGDLLIPSHTLSNPNEVLTSSLWPMGIVPFVISTNYTVAQLSNIYMAMVKIQEATCIQFVQRHEHEDYVSIVNTNTGCWSAVGKVGGEQLLGLQGDGCLRNYGSALHELMHVLGFMHEQNRPERDEHVDINWENIKLGSRRNFQKNCLQRGFGVKYDYDSITHYHGNAYSVNGNSTISDKDDLIEEKMLEVRTDLSKGDIHKINRIYKCDRDKPIDKP